MSCRLSEKVTPALPPSQKRQKQNRGGNSEVKEEIGYERDKLYHSGYEGYS
jgi:hypothetical protein